MQKVLQDLNQQLHRYRENQNRLPEPIATVHALRKDVNALPLHYLRSSTSEWLIARGTVADQEALPFTDR
jgi:hypothetical protein